VDLGIRESFSDVGATIMDAFGIEKTVEGKSFWKDVITALK
jgi:phosphopentomutase